jgi:6-phosphofructokinase
MSNFGPQTIDNDVAFIDKSFGFDTAVAEAAKVWGLGFRV